MIAHQRHTHTHTHTLSLSHAHHHTHTLSLFLSFSLSHTGHSVLRARRHAHRHDSFICETWLIHMWDMTHSYVRTFGTACTAQLLKEFQDAELLMKDTLLDAKRVAGATHTATHCNKLQQLATNCPHWNTLQQHDTLQQHSLQNVWQVQHTATYCNILQHTATTRHSATTSKPHSLVRNAWQVQETALLQCVAVCCSVLQCAAVWYSVLPPNIAIHCSTLQHNAAHCSTLQQHDTLQQHSRQTPWRETRGRCNTLQHTATTWHCNNITLQQHLTHISRRETCGRCVH